MHRPLTPILAPLLLTACATAVTGLTCPTTDWVEVAIPADATALEAWQGGKDVADATFGADATWLGGMSGVAIGRDGRPDTAALVSGWAFTFCDGMDQVGFSVGPPASAGQCAIDVVDCDEVGTFDLFAVDSPELIATAFPGDGADATYGLSLTLGLAPTWTITNTSTTTSVKVDAQTGAIVTP